MPQNSYEDSTNNDLSGQYPGMAKRDVKLIAGNLLGMGNKIEEKNPGREQSRRMGKQIQQAVQRLKEKKDKTPAEVELLGRAKNPHARHARRPK